jgi:hypothetical protein
MLSELMLRGATINSKATSTRGKGCHDVMVVRKKIRVEVQAHRRKKTGKNDAFGSTRITVVACPSAEFRSMALMNIPSLTIKKRFQVQRWSLELKTSR